MCEMLVRVEDKECSKDAHEHMHSGDVVAVAEDGWQWGVAEKFEQSLRIIKLPNVSLGVGNTFTAVEVASGPAQGRIRPRAFYLDFDGLMAGWDFYHYLCDDSRAVDSITLPLTDTEMLAFRIAKTPIEDIRTL
jgi:hypothetical protein